MHADMGAKIRPERLLRCLCDVLQVFGQSLFSFRGSQRSGSTRTPCAGAASQPAPYAC